MAEAASAQFRRQPDQVTNADMWSQGIFIFSAISDLAFAFNKRDMLKIGVKALEGKSSILGQLKYGNTSDEINQFSTEDSGKIQSPVK